LGLAEVVFELGEVRGDAAQAFGGDAGSGAKECEAVGDGAEGAMALARDLGDGQFLNAIKVADGVDGGRFAAGAQV
jgi:hypothetical protein